MRPRRRSGAPAFLVLQYRIPLGCCVHATPIYAALKASHPHSKIVVASFGLGLDVLAHDPHIDLLIPTPEPKVGLGHILSAASSLRSQLAALGVQPTQVLQDASNRRGSLALLALLLRLAPIRGFGDLPALYDDHLAYDPNLSLIDNNLRLVGEIDHSEPAVYFSATELEHSRGLLDRANPLRKPVIAFIVQGSGAQPNSWHDDRFATVIQHVESLGYSVVYLGTEAEAPVIDRIRSLAGSTGVSLAGLTSVPQLAALLCLCDQLISVDTGSMHVGRATSVPMTVLGPSWQPAIEWLPLGLSHVIVLRGNDRAEIPPNYRLDEVTPEAGIAAFTRLDAHYPPSANAREQRATRLLSNARPVHPAR